MNESETTVLTHCRLCMAVCGLAVTVDAEANKVVRVAPDKDNPYTWRDFCAKARTGAELLEHPRRITAPMRRVGDAYVEASWDEAIADIAARVQRVIDAGGPDAVGFYTGNPSAFTMSSAIFFTGLVEAVGSKNRFWYGSIDENTFHLVAEEMYGSPAMTLAIDVDECDCFLLVGTNPAESTLNWVENTPDGWRRILARQASGADLIVVDPRRTLTADKADTHLPVRPGTDWAFLLALVKIILDNGWEHAADCARFSGAEGLRALVSEASLDDLGARCGIEVEVLTDVARRFAHASTAVCLTRTGVAHHDTGTIGEWLGHVLNAITGRLDRPGGRRFERGVVDLPKLFGLMAPPGKHLSRVRGLPAVAGYHALAELPDEILTPGPGQIRAMVINAGNPVVSGPDGGALDAALADLDLLVAVDLVQRESHRHAHWLLPAAHWLERDELWLLGGGSMEQPYVQYGRRAVAPPPDVREEWEIFTDLALALRRPLFGKRGVNSFVRVTRRLARITRRPDLAFRPRWIERLMVLSGRRVRWKDILAHPHGWIYDQKEYGRLDGALRTDDRRVHLAPEPFVTEARALLRRPATTAPEDFPMLLVNRRRHDSMNSWLNELPGLHKHQRTNQLEVNPADAEVLGLTTGSRAVLASPVAEIELPVVVTDRVGPGVVCSEHGWGSRTFDPKGGGDAEGHGANRNLVVDSRRLDPLSQIPAFSSTWVRVGAAADAS